MTGTPTIDDVVLLLKDRQWRVHCGQYHQWRTVEQCDDKSCMEFKALIARLPSQVETSESEVQSRNVWIRRVVIWTATFLAVGLALWKWMS